MSAADSPGATVSWAEFVAAEPALARRCRDSLDAHKHKTIATLRRDGSPRISGIELIFWRDDVWCGSMLGAVKARDLIRDGRYALHSGSADPPEWPGDAKFAGIAEVITDHDLIRQSIAEHPEAGETEPDALHFFRLAVAEVTFTGLNEARDKLVIETWDPGRGLRRIER